MQDSSGLLKTDRQICLSPFLRFPAHSTAHGFRVSNPTACAVTIHVLSFVSVKKAAYVYCYCISSLWERLVAPSDARIVSRKEAA